MSSRQQNVQRVDAWGSTTKSRNGIREEGEVLEDCGPFERELQTGERLLLVRI
jgi:hypothetical protein